MGAGVGRVGSGEFHLVSSRSVCDSEEFVVFEAGEKSQQDLEQRTHSGGKKRQASYDFGDEHVDQEADASEEGAQRDSKKRPKSQFYFPPTLPHRLLREYFRSAIDRPPEYGHRESHQHLGQDVSLRGAQDRSFVHR